jgi:hypothetical protein
MFCLFLLDYTTESFEKVNNLKSALGFEGDTREGGKGDAWVCAVRVGCEQLPARAGGRVRIAARINANLTAAAPSMDTIISIDM